MSLQTLCVLVLALVAVVHSHSHGPRQSVFAEGVDLKHLPDGGWTGWVNSDGPSGSGDKETYEHIIKRYGKSCASGIPCAKKDIVVAQVRTHEWNVNIERQTPKETGDVVHFGLDGFTCVNDEQPAGKKCKDYEVRFFCRGCDTEFCCLPNYLDIIARILNVD